MLLCMALLAAGCASNRRIAVLPFENLSADPSDDWLRDGFSESLGDHFLYVKDIWPKHREDINAAAKSVDQPVYLPFGAVAQAAQIGLALDAGRVMIGSFRHREDELITFTRLIDCKSGQILHETRQRVAGPANFRFFSQIQEMVQAVEQTDPEKLEVPGRRTKNFKAFEYFIQGRLSTLRDTDEEYRNAATWFREAIKLDYQYALAYVGLAEALSHWGFLIKQDGKAYQDLYRKAYENLNLAEKYDAAIPVYHKARTENLLKADSFYVVGMTQLKNQEWTLAQQSFQKALDLTPHDAMAIFQLGEIERLQGRIDAAREQYMKALELRPNLTPAMDGLEKVKITKPEVPAP